MRKPSFFARISDDQIVPYGITDLMLETERRRWRSVELNGGRKTSVRVTLFYHDGRIRRARIVGKKKRRALLRGLYDIFVEPEPRRWPTDPDQIADAGTVEVTVARPV